MNGDLNVVKVWYQNDWGQYARRDERIVRAFQRNPRVGRIVHLEPPVCEEALRASPQKLDPLGWTRRRCQGVVEDSLTLLTPSFRHKERQTAPAAICQKVEQTLEQLEIFALPSVLWISAPALLGAWILRSFGERFEWIVAEVEDDHRCYLEPGTSNWFELERRYEAIIRSADLLVSNSAVALERFQRFQPRGLLLENAVDMEEYEGVVAAPACLEDISEPRVGYVGNLGIRLRHDLILAAAKLCKDATFVFAGDGADSLPPAIKSQPNVQCVGRIDPALVPGFLTHMDALILPHEVSEMTDAMNPQKLYEYLASGTPVVSTSVPAAIEFSSVVNLQDDPGGFAESVKRVLEEKTDHAARQQQTMVVGRTWHKLVEIALRTIISIPDPGAPRRLERKLDYYRHDRPELRALVPKTAQHILDVGCGTGAFGWALKSESEVTVTGIELDVDAGHRAKEKLDHVLIGDAIEHLQQLEAGAYDVVVFADLLEHLADPDCALKESRRLLRANGCLLVSLPNVRHWSVIRDLLEGKWEYRDAGILDRTHLRFFTRSSALELLSRNGFQVEETRAVHWSKERIPGGIVDVLRRHGLDTSSLAAESGEHQYLFVARPVEQERPHVAVVIPVHNAAEQTEACLQALARDQFAGSREVVVVDNGSTDSTQQVLRRYSWVRIVRCPENLGFSGGVNRGLASVSADLVCVLNNDTIPNTGWLDRLVEAMQTYEVAAVGPCTNYAVGAQQLLVPAQQAATRDSIREFGETYCERHRGQVQDVSLLSGFCMLFDQNVIESVGGFNDNYPIGTFEDTELCRNLRRNGHRLLIVHDSFVYHEGNQTFRVLGIEMAEQQARNQQVFERRHREDLTLHAMVALEAGNAERAFALSRAALERWPEDLDAARTVALACAAAGAAEPARKLALLYRATCPCDPAVATLLSESLSAKRSTARNRFPAPAPAASF